MTDSTAIARTKTDINSLIRRSYFWPFNAAHISFYFEHDVGFKISAAELKSKWAEELEHNAVMRQLGDRPEKGFLSSDHVKLAERLVT